MCVDLLKVETIVKSTLLPYEIERALGKEWSHIFFIHDINLMSNQGQITKIIFFPKARRRKTYNDFIVSQPKIHTYVGKWQDSKIKLKKWKMYLGNCHDSIIK